MTLLITIGFLVLAAIYAFTGNDFLELLETGESSEIVETGSSGEW
ncbi:hypothetical protein ACFLXI_04135 [Chloroflexota bacterium]